MDNPSQITFENVWQRSKSDLRKEILMVWNQFNPGLEAAKAEERLQQVVWIARNEFNQIIGISTAVKAYIKQLRDNLYSVRVLILPPYRLQGMAADMLVKTRDHLEKVHDIDEADGCIGLITLVESDVLKAKKTEAVWPKSKMVYIGNSGKGHHIRVYYFGNTTPIESE